MLMSSLTFLGMGVKGAAEGAMSEKHCSDCNRLVPMALSGNNLYMAWPNNDTGHWNVFFAKSTDGGKTLSDDKRA
jgi:hypothetical protein